MLAFQGTAPSWPLWTKSPVHRSIRRWQMLCSTYILLFLLQTCKELQQCCCHQKYERRKEVFFSHWPGNSVSEKDCVGNRNQFSWPWHCICRTDTTMILQLLQGKKKRGKERPLFFLQSLCCCSTALEQVKTGRVLQEQRSSLMLVKSYPLPP